jgi:hypothetical protein
MSRVALGSHGLGQYAEDAAIITSQGTGQQRAPARRQLPIQRSMIEFVRSA